MTTPRTGQVPARTANAHKHNRHSHGSNTGARRSKASRALASDRRNRTVAQIALLCALARAWRGVTQTPALRTNDSGAHA